MYDLLFLQPVHHSLIPLFSIGFNTPTLVSSFRRKPESRNWMPAYAGMTNTPQLAAGMLYLSFS
jgi:hypothetical protein